jgi:predicted SnoaL-like aldol condensation-catalyzing enzyme
MRWRVALSIMLATALPVLAEDWTVNGKDYHNVKVTKVDADKVHIMYDGGIGSVNLADLPPDLQKKFNYDPAAAKTAANAEAQRQAEADRQLAIEEKQNQKIAAAQDAKDESDQKQADLAKKASNISVQVVQVLPDGILCEKQVTNYVNRGGGVSTDRSDGFGKAPAGGGMVATMVGSGVIIFVQSAPSGLTDEQKISVHAYRDGTYSYTDTQGAQRTVEKWVSVAK